MPTGSGDRQSRTAESGAQSFAIQRDEAAGLQHVGRVAWTRVVGVTVSEGAKRYLVRVREKLPGSDGVAVERAGRAELNQLA